MQESTLSLTEFYCGTFDDPAGPTVVWASGDIDASSAARLGAEIEPRLSPGATVLLYSAAVTAVDTAGLRALLHAAAAADQIGSDFALTAPSAALRHVLQDCGVEDVFTVYSTVAEATAACRSRRTRTERPELVPV